MLSTQVLELRFLSMFLLLATVAVGVALAAVAAAASNRCSVANTEESFYLFTFYFC